MLVLCYHAISDRWDADIAVTPERLERQLALLVRRGYRGMTFTDAVTQPLPGKILAVTFDDGYRSLIDHALPALNRAGVPGTVFVPTDSIGADAPMSWPGLEGWLDGPHTDELMPMSWDEVRQLADAGWEIGSHTRTHPRLTTLHSGALQSELHESRRECEEQVRVRCRSLAYPYGDVDARVVAAARSAGYEAACALPRGRFARPQHLLWPRVGVYGQDRPWRFLLKTSPVTRAARELPAWTAADRLRRAIGHRGRGSAPHPRG